MLEEAVEVRLRQSARMDFKRAENFVGVRELSSAGVMEAVEGGRGAGGEVRRVVRLERGMGEEGEMEGDMREEEIRYSVRLRVGDEGGDCEGEGVGQKRARGLEGM